MVDRLAKQRRVAAFVFMTAFVISVGAGCTTIRAAAPPTAAPASPSPPSAATYDGPLELTPKERRTAAEQMAGAAARAVQCSTRVIGGLGGEPYAGGAMANPDKALANAPSEAGLFAPLDGFVREVATTDRVLYAYRVGATVKEAIIDADTPTLDRGRTGWHPESWARCDYSEFPDPLVERIGLRIWTDQQGKRIPTYELNAYAGAAHCSWEASTFLTTDGVTYVGKPPADLVPEYTPATYDRGLSVPSDARDSGYRRNGLSLWIAADRKSAYVGSPIDAERWPATVKDVACA